MSNRHNPTCVKCHGAGWHIVHTCKGSESRCEKQCTENMCDCVNPDYDPTPWCSYHGNDRKACDCLERMADND